MNFSEKKTYIKACLTTRWVSCNQCANPECVFQAPQCGGSNRPYAFAQLHVPTNTCVLKVRLLLTYPCDSSTEEQQTLWVRVPLPLQGIVQLVEHYTVNVGSTPLLKKWRQQVKSGAPCPFGSSEQPHRCQQPGNGYTGSATSKFKLQPRL